MTSKLASLHAGLIARKGEAMPALSNPGFSYVDTARPSPVLTQVPVPAPVRDSSNGTKPTDFPEVEPTPPVTAKPIVRQSPPLNREKPTQPNLKPNPEAITPRASREPVRKAEEDNHPRPHKLTFRMTQDQRHRLRIAAAQRDKSLQQILSDALDNHLDGLCACSPKGCTCLARNEARQTTG